MNINAVIIAVVTPSAREAWTAAWADVRELHHFMDSHKDLTEEEAQDAVSEVMTSALHLAASNVLTARELALEVA